MEPALKSGGHHRKTKQARPLSRKTVRHVAGLVSSAFARAERWGLVPSNPVERLVRVGRASGGIAGCSSHEAVFQYVFQLVFQFKSFVL
jgi:hypothetical protein